LNHFAEWPIAEWFAVKSTRVHTHYIWIRKPSSAVSWAHRQWTFDVYIKIWVQKIGVLMG